MEKKKIKKGIKMSFSESAITVRSNTEYDCVKNNILGFFQQFANPQSLGRLFPF